MNHRQPNRFWTCLPDLVCGKVSVDVYKRQGNRLVMMHDGKIIFDVEGEEKKKLTVSDLLEKFQIASGDELANDRMLLG